MELENINPNVFRKSDERKITSSELDEDVADPIDSREIFGNLKIFIERKRSSKKLFFHRFNKKH
jgi:hypothetical protein